ncbi:MAG TPA: LPXTG cell wall anchor domain-containing protein [Atopostipes sp.]|nr:LPXTG cell wall anchor domain-containing protein [Atopostipes sp.]
MDGPVVFENECSEPIDSGDPSDPVDPEDKDLPRTGVAPTYTWLALIFFGLGIGIHFYKKRRFTE